MKSYWVSWYHTPDLGGFELSAPWWVSGARIVADRLAFDEQREEPIVCAAVRADHPEGARDRILTAYDVRPDGLEWRFVEERPSDWSPFTDRFPKTDWMQWPITAAA